ncbi:MAG: acyl-CoA dehydrogenase family protein [Actinomycetota bacterium]
MDLTFTDEQQMLRETVRAIMTRFSTPAIVRSLEDDPVGFRQDLWSELAKTGLTGLSIPDEFGGAGSSNLETMILYEEMGRSLCSTPHFVSAVLGASALMHAGRTELLPSIASGKIIVTCAWPEPDGSYGQDGIRSEVVNGRITGAKLLVPFASSADQVLCVARGSEGLGLYLVDPTSGAKLTHTPTIGSDAEYLIELDQASAERVGDWIAWEQALTDGWIALAAYAIGGARKAHEMAVEYAIERVQFDRPIGSFQGIAHPLADAAMEIEGGSVLVCKAAWARSNGDDASTLAAMSKLYACDVFRRVTKIGQQVLGGIGFTRDIDMQLYFRRAKQLELSWGDPRFLEERIASAELDAPKPFVRVQ